MFEELVGFYLGNPAIRTVGVALARSFLGWVENILEDGKFDMYDLKQLLVTFVRTIPQALGWNATGLPVEAALLSDFFGTKLFKKK
ncbi:hypothetical protein HYT52_01685 [Candidatus Woesearchaeota archaeon]|nr:hypothetical protein [Candidatus Woesearchaeota archaeon]